MSNRSDRQSGRLKAILRELQQSTAVTISDLCKEHKASVATIRRDLEHLERLGLLRRTHGGAILIEPLFYEAFKKNASFVDMVGRYAEEKRRIGRAAADLVKPGNSIVLTAGTTTTEVIRCLPFQTGIKVVTNTVNVAMELSKRKDVEVFVTGGHLRGEWFSLVGSTAIESLRQAFVDIAFIGADGVDLSAGLTCVSPDEAAVNRTMVAQAARCIAVVDRTKFGIVTSWEICPVKRCEIIVTDTGASDETIAPYLDLGIDVRRA
jgi:DeoR family transcriptional regulator, aga operon transcriptional repressor